MKKIMEANEWYWIIVAAVFALMLWLAPKVDGSELDDYLKKKQPEPSRVFERAI